MASASETHFYVTIDVLDAKNASINRIDGAASGPNYFIEIENTSRLARSAKLEAILPSGATAQISFNVAGTLQKNWEHELVNIPPGRKLSGRCYLTRNGGSNPAEQIVDQLYSQWASPTWKRDNSYQPVIITIDVS
jgi:hypothetical protein